MATTSPEISRLIVEQLYPWVENLYSALICNPVFNDGSWGRLNRASSHLHIVLATLNSHIRQQNDPAQRVFP